MFAAARREIAAGHRVALWDCVSEDHKESRGVAPQVVARFGPHNPHDIIVGGVPGLVIQNGPDGSPWAGAAAMRLVTKGRFYHKPSRMHVKQAVELAMTRARDDGFDVVVMPQIASGRDRRPWRETLEDIHDVAARVAPCLRLVVACGMDGDPAAADAGTSTPAGVLPTAPPAAHPSVEPGLWRQKMLSYSQCAPDRGCDLCRAWAEAVAECAPADPLSPAEALQTAINTAVRARERGFDSHQLPLSPDKVEEGSRDAAPDTPELAAALRDAETELTRHLAPGPAPVQPDPAFTARRLIADAQAAWRAAQRAPQLLRASVRQVNNMIGEEFWGMTRGLVEDIARGSLSRLAPRQAARESRPGGSRLDPVFAFPFVAWQRGKGRLCINFRPYNGLFNPTSYRLPTVRDLALAGSRLRWLTKLDLKAAFRRVAVPAAVRGALGVAAAGVPLAYDALPFGWTFSPEVFAVTLEPVLAEIRRRIPGAAVVVYVDDIAIAAPDAVAATRAATEAMSCLRQHGFLVSAAKTFLRPVRTLRFLGVLVEAGANPSVSVPRDTLERLFALRDRVRANPADREALLEVWGLTSFLAYTVDPRLAIHRAALDPVADAVLSEAHLPWGGDPDDGAAVADLVGSAVDAVAGAWAEGPHPVVPSGRRRAVLVTDASSSGGGARLAIDDVVLQGGPQWSLEEAALPSAARELMVLAWAVETWADVIRGRMVDWLCDASAAVSSIGSWAPHALALRMITARVDTAARACDARIAAWWYRRDTPEIRGVDAASRWPGLRLGGTADVAFPEPAIRRCAQRLGLEPTLHDGWFSGVPRAAADYTAAMPGGGVGRGGPPGRAAAGWLGPPGSPEAWARRVVWSHTSRSSQGRSWAHFCAAARSAPVVMMMPILRGAGLQPGAAGAAVVGRAPAVEAGDPILVWDVAAAAWASRPSRAAWDVVAVFASPDAPVDRSMSQEERRELMFASGFHRHPGPPPPKRRGTSAAGAAAAIDAAVCPAPVIPPPGRACAIDRAAAARPPTVVQDAIAEAAMAMEAGEPPTHPSIDEVLQAMMAPSAAWAVGLAVRSGWVHPAVMSSGLAVAQVAAALEEADDVVSASTAARAATAAGRIRATASAIGLADAPWHAATLDAVAVTWIRARLRRPGHVELGDVAPKASAPAVAADVGAFAARLRRRLLWRVTTLPSVSAGPVSHALLVACGANARHDSSPKRVVWGWELKAGIDANPDIVAAHPAAVAAIVFMGASMWRSIYVRHLRKCDVARWTAPTGEAPRVGDVPVTTHPSAADVTAFSRHPAAVGAGAAARPTAAEAFVARWDGAHKTNRLAGDASLPSTARFGFVAAPWALGAITGFVPDVHDPTDTSPLFPDPTGGFLSYGYLARVLRALLRGLDGADRATLHGLRLGIDAELRAHGVADEIRDSLGWWKRTVRRMAEHYEALDAGRLVAAGALYGSMKATQLAPGLMTSSAALRSPGATAIFGQRPAALRSATTSVGTARGLPPAPPTPPTPAGTADGQGDADPCRPRQGAEAPPASKARKPIRCSACVAAGRDGGGHNRRNPLCPSRVVAPTTAPPPLGQPTATSAGSNVPGDDASESDSDDEATCAAAAERPPPPPLGIPSVLTTERPSGRPDPAGDRPPRAVATGTAAAAHAGP